MKGEDIQMELILINENNITIGAYNELIPSPVYPKITVNDINMAFIDNVIMKIKSIIYYLEKDKE